jgi:HPr kinase/phosphorylase
MFQVNVARLHEDNREALSLAWIAGRDGSAELRRDAAASAALIGHLNLTHPNSIQVLGAYEASMLAGGDRAARARFAAQLCASVPAALVLADGVGATEELLEQAESAHVPLFTTPLPAPRVIEKLARYLGKALADAT